MTNTAAIKQWTDELRSGNRNQTTGKLDEEINGVRRQCCLGVACDLFRDEIGLKVVVRTDDFKSLYEYGEHQETGLLPTEVMDYLGFDDYNPAIELPLNNEQRNQVDLDAMSSMFTLAQLNDGGLTFEQIADVIDYFII